jgi:hypothetical protein
MIGEDVAKSLASWYHLYKVNALTGISITRMDRYRASEFYVNFREFQSHSRFGESLFNLPNQDRLLPMLNDDPNKASSDTSELEEIVTSLPRAMHANEFFRRRLSRKLTAAFDRAVAGNNMSLFLKSSELAKFLGPQPLPYPIDPHGSYY